MFSTIRAAARYDLAFFRTHPLFAAAVVLFVFIPALYAFVYLSSLWDPASHTRNLVVVLVDEDQGTDYGGAPVRLGEQLIATLSRDARFDYVRATDPAEARRMVDRGHAAFAVLVPREFSRQAMDSEAPGAARLVIHASEGNNYTGAGFARRFAPDVSQALNQSLNEQRFAAVLRVASGSADGLKTLRTAVAQLGGGATELAAGVGQARGASAQLADGAAKLQGGTRELSEGLKQLDPNAQKLAQGFVQVGDGVRAMRGGLPPKEQLDRLAQGSRELASGQRTLTAGLAKLEPGSRRRCRRLRR